MIETYSFGEWCKQRRKQLPSTQKQVATAVTCSTAMIKKIEAHKLTQALATLANLH